MKERETASVRERSINSARNGENGEGRESSVGEGYGLPLVASQAHKYQPGSSGNEMDWLEKEVDGMDRRRIRQPSQVEEERRREDKKRRKRRKKKEKDR